MVKNEWFDTDTLQWCKKLNDSTFEIIDVDLGNDSRYMFGMKHLTINVDTFSEEELENYVKGYYESLKEVKETYGDDWKQIMAEIIIETGSIDEYVDFNKFKGYVENTTGLNLSY